MNDLNNKPGKEGHEGPHLNNFLLWIPVCLGLLVLAWLIEQKSHVVHEDVFVDKLPQPVTYETPQQNITVIESDQAGHYVFSGFINNREVMFLLDTGATTVAIPEGLVDYLGLSYGQKIRVNTANGVAPAFVTRLDEVRVGNIALGNIQGSILPGMKGDKILLGMTFLKHLSITQEAGQIKLVQAKVPDSG